MCFAITSLAHDPSARTAGATSYGLPLTIVIENVPPPFPPWLSAFPSRSVSGLALNGLAFFASRLGALLISYDPFGPRGSFVIKVTVFVAGS